MLDTIWEQLRCKLRESEVEEAIYLLGRDRIERTDDVVKEIESLLGLFDEVPSQFKDLSSHKVKVEFYLNKLAGKARELGVNTTDLIGLKTPRDRFIFEFLAEGNTRPSTADSSKFNEKLPGLDSINEYKGKMVSFVEDHQEELKRGIDSEYEFLTCRAAAIQQELLGMASIPSAKEVNDFAKKLEDAVINEIHPAFFKQSGKIPTQQNDVEKTEALDYEFDFELEKPQIPVCKPKLREIKKPTRPATPAIVPDLNSTTQSFGNGKLSRRLRSLVKDHQDLPM